MRACQMLFEGLARLGVSVALGAGAGLLTAGLMLYHDAHLAEMGRHGRVVTALIGTGTGCLTGGAAALILVLGMARRRPAAERWSADRAPEIRFESDNTPF